jgi:hypothetical protein
MPAPGFFLFSIHLVHHRECFLHLHDGTWPIKSLSMLITFLSFISLSFIFGGATHAIADDVVDAFEATEECTLTVKKSSSAPHVHYIRKATYEVVLCRTLPNGKKEATHYRETFTLGNNDKLRMNFRAHYERCEESRRETVAKLSALFKIEQPLGTCDRLPNVKKTESLFSSSTLTNWNFLVDFFETSWNQR